MANIREGLDLVPILSAPRLSFCRRNDSDVDVEGDGCGFDLILHNCLWRTRVDEEPICGQAERDFHDSQPGIDHYQRFLVSPFHRATTAYGLETRYLLCNLPRGWGLDQGARDLILCRLYANERRIANTNVFSSIILRSTWSCSTLSSLSLRRSLSVSGHVYRFGVSS